jgi:hypothetical protein
MKNTIIFVLCASAIFIGSCCKKNGTTPSTQIVNFDLPFENFSTLPAIPGIPVELPVSDSITSYMIATYSDSLFKQNKSSADKIVSVKASNLILSIKDATKKIDFVKSIKIFIADKNGDNKVLLGYKDPVDPTLNAVLLDVVDQNIKRYIIADSFKVILGGQLRANTPIPAGTQLQIGAIFKCQANP